MKHYLGKRGKPSKKIWEILRQLALKRDRNRCQICFTTEDLQIDHCFSSSQCVRLRYSLCNLTTLCSSCHSMKTYHTHGYEKKVDEIVRKREGEMTWEWMKVEASKSATWELLELLNMQQELENETSEVVKEKLLPF